jgi:hypothetical protein
LGDPVSGCKTPKIPLRSQITFGLDPTVFSTCSKGSTEDTHTHTTHTKNARQRASLVARLAHNLLRGRYLRTLALGLVLGKIAHAFPAVATPRLSPQEAQNSAYAATQVAVNNVARTITGTKSSDNVWLDVLLRNVGNSLPQPQAG